MSIYKTVKKEKYVTINNEFLAIDTLSWGAKGLLAYIISKPANWQIRKTDLIKRSDDGTTKIEGYLLELMAHGFMNWYVNKNEIGQIENWTYEVYESPDDNPNKEACISEGLERIEKRKAKNKQKNSKKTPKSDNPIVDKKPKQDSPKSDSPKSDNPVQDNPSYSNKDLTKKDFSNTDFTKTYKSLSIELEENIKHVLQNEFDYKERLINKILEEIETRHLENVTLKSVIDQARSMQSKKGIDMPHIWFVNGLEWKVDKTPVENETPLETALESQIKDGQALKLFRQFTNFIEG